MRLTGALDSPHVKGTKGAGDTEGDEQQEERMSRLHKLATSVKVPSFISLRIVVLMALMVVMLSCSGKSENTSPFKVIDSGMWTLDDPWQTWWLDKDRVTFRSNDSFQYGVGPFKIHVWNTATGQVVSTNVDRLRCAREGQVLYEEKDETKGKKTYYRGPIERAREYPSPGPHMRLDPTFDCAWVRKFPPFTDGPYKYKLRGENYLHVLEPNENGKKGKAIYHASPKDPGREVPFYLQRIYRCVHCNQGNVRSCQTGNQLILYP